MEIIGDVNLLLVDLKLIAGDRQTRNDGLGVHHRFHSGDRLSARTVDQVLFGVVVLGY